MKSKLVNTRLLKAMLGVFLLLGSGLAEAALSACSAVSPSSQSVMLGSTSQQLTATCNNLSFAFGYKWKIGATSLTSGSGDTGTCTASTCTVPAANLPSAGTYTVTVTNNNADGAGTVPASASITVTPPAYCDPTYGPVEPVNPADLAQGDKVTLTAHCNPGAGLSTLVDGYLWKVASPSAPTAFGAIPAGDLISTSATGPTITVKLPAEGTLYQVAADVTASKASSNAVFSGAPSCTLESVAPTVSGSAVRINSGASAVLMPTCNAETSIDWYAVKVGDADTPIPTPAGGVVSPTTDTGYYVVGNNLHGSSGSNIVTVTVTQAPVVPTVPVPLCSLTASPLTISTGESTMLIATCPGATGFNWTGSGVAYATTTSGNVSATPTGSGAKTYTVAGYNNSGTSAEASVVVNVSALPLSTCSAISPSAPSVTLGSPSPLLTATCTNSPTAYVWKVGTTTLSCTGVTCTVPADKLTPIGTYNVTVKANNAGGTGTAAASTTVTVTPQPLSACTAIAPEAPSVVLGSPSPTLTATCTNSPTAYVWKVGTTPLSCTGATCIVPATKLPAKGTYNVTVKANNAGGNGTAAASATVTVTTTAVPSCTAIAPATSIVALGSASSQLTATCNNSPTTYVWKVGTTTLSGCTGATCTVPAGNLSSAGSYTVTVKANNAGGAGTQTASATITVGSATTCPQALSVIAMDFAATGNTKHVQMNRNKAIAFEITTDGSGKTGSFDTAQSSIGGTVFRFINVSKTKCDFSYTNYDAHNGCAATGSYAATVNYTLGTATPSVCKLQKSTTYYVNVRNENILPATSRTASKRGQDSCPAGSICAFVFGVY